MIGGERTERPVCSKAKHSDVDAVVFCSKCEKFYCEDCEEAHNDLLGDHVMYLQKVSSGEFFTEKCQEHSKYPLDIFCQTHWEKGGNAVCCVRCKESNHSTCTTKNIDEVNLDQLKIQFLESIDRLRLSIGTVSSLEDNVLAKQEELENMINTAKEDVIQVFNSIRGIISEQEQAVLSKLESLSEKLSYEEVICTSTELDAAGEVLDAADEIDQNWDPKNPLMMIQKASAVKTSIEEMDAKVAVIRDAAFGICDSTPIIKFIYDKSLLEQLKSIGTIAKLDPPTEIVSMSTYDGLKISWDPFVLENFRGTIKYQVEIKEDDKASEYEKKFDGPETECIISGLAVGKKYLYRVRVCIDEDTVGNWSKDCVTTISEVKYNFVWKECPNIRFCDDSQTTIERINTGYTTVIGTRKLPPSSLNSWNVKIISTADGDNGLMLGVAPYDIDTSHGIDNSESCGWYFSIYGRNLYSGPPQSKRSGAYNWCDSIVVGDTITVTIDTRGEKGVLSFSVNGRSLGPAYDNIPLDKPLVPAAFIYKNEERFKLVSVNSDAEVIPNVPAPIRSTKFDFVWKECPNARFCDGSHKVIERINSKYTTIIGTRTLPPSSSNSWDIKVVRTNAGNNGLMVGVAPYDINTAAGVDNSESCGWYFSIYGRNLYSGPPQNKRHEAYTQYGQINVGDVITVTIDTRGDRGVLSFSVNGRDLGVAFNDIPLNKLLVPVVFFYSNGERIELLGADVGAEAGAPNAQYDFVWKECPNTRFCDDSHKVVERINTGYTTIIGTRTLPPSSLNSWNIKVINTKEDDNGLMLGVAPYDIDTSAGEDNSENCGWYFSIYGRNLYSGPPQNKRSASYTQYGKINVGDVITVTIDTRGAKGILSFSVNGRDLGVAFNDIPLDKLLVPAAFIYKSEERIGIVSVNGARVDAGAIAGAPNAQYDFVWKECPNTRFCGDSHRIVERINTGFTTVIGTRTLPPRSLNAWDIKVISTKEDDNGLMLGVAPYDINTSQGIDNSENCGWYFSTFRRNLYSGPPQNKRSASYTQCDKIKNGDIITVTIDTRGAKGILSFSVNGMNLGPAYDNIPLDKLLVPVAFLYKSEERIGIISINGTPTSIADVLSPQYDFVWKECPNTRFCGDASHKTVERINSGFTTIIGTKTLPPRSLNSWNVKVISTAEGDNGLMLGVAPYDINTSQGIDNSESCGWYFSIYGRNLYSGPPQNKRCSAYNRCDPIVAGDVITVTIDTRGEKGVLSFSVNGRDLGVAFNDIPLNKLLVPAAFIYKSEERIKLVGADAVPGGGQSPVRGTKFDFVWKDCPRFCRDSVRYSLDHSKKVAKKDDVNSDIFCTMIGKSSVPAETTVWWKISCRSLFDREGKEFFVGVAPSNIDQKALRNWGASGWYLCWGSGKLFSGPPHNYRDKSYCDSRNVNVGSVVCLNLDTNGRCGTLSFAFNDISQGVAYDDIPLDKPLVPCVLLHYAGDSVEIV